MRNVTSAKPVLALLANRAANTVRYGLMNLFILGGTAAMAYGGIWTWSGMILSFLLIGYVDELLGDAGSKEAMPPVWFMQLMLYLTLPLLLLATLVCFNVVTAHGFPALDALMRACGFDPVAARGRAGLWPNSGALVSTGMFYGLAGVTVAHELVHRTDSPLDQVIGRWLLAFTWDTGFAIEHVYGHHKHVGTALDPATARRGEYVFAFVARSTVGQIISALRHERDRLRRRSIPDRPWSNRFWRGQAMTAVVVLFYVAFLGPIGILLSLFTGAIGKLYLELVNYIEHYGLVRLPGTRIEARHSWDSYRRLSTGMFYNLQLHANHHRLATRPFWQLEQSAKAAPTLPMGYMPTILLAFVPFAWTWYSNPLLADWDRRFASPEEREYLKGKGLLLG